MASETAFVLQDFVPQSTKLTCIVTFLAQYIGGINQRISMVARIRLMASLTLVRRSWFVYVRVFDEAAVTLECCTQSVSG